MPTASALLELVMLSLLPAGGVLAARWSDESADCDRARSPLEEASVGVAAADAVVVVEVTAVGVKDATAKVTAVLKGASAEVAVGQTLKIRGVESEKARSRGGCGGASTKVGQRHVALLWGPTAGAPDYTLVDAFGGWRVHAPAVQASVEAALAEARPSSRWGAESAGVQARLLLAKPSDAKQVDLLVVLRNVSQGPVELHYKSWPVAEQSRCVLKIEDAATRTPVAAREVPIAKEDIAAYFSKHGRAFQRSIPPGEAWVWTLPRVTSAEPGWGYKEELGFRYYPVAKHGKHLVSAECINLFGPGSRLVTEALPMNL